MAEPTNNGTNAIVNAINQSATNTISGFTAATEGIKSEVSKLSSGMESSIKELSTSIDGSQESEEDKSEEITKIDEKAIEEQIKKLSNLRKKSGDISKYIQKIEQIASTDENLMPHIIEAVSNKVTIGEVCNSLRNVWGEYRPKEIL